jgi:endonuclease/exonuclease/phosphatase family metal-dependent hydrolase
LQEVLRPWGTADPLARLAATLDLHVLFGATRCHRDGLLGNALLTRWPAHHVEQLDLSQTPWESRGAIVGTYRPWDGPSLSVIATHLALGARTRAQQVRGLLTHPLLQCGPLVLLGDLNAWRPTQAMRDLARVLGSPMRQGWPRTFPSAAPLLALDRIYTREVRVVALRVHTTAAARRGSDHLPVVAQVVF